MNVNQRTRIASQYGDFQTPRELAFEVCEYLRGRGLKPRSLLESSCGQGTLLLVALEFFPSITKAIGLDINIDYVESLQNELKLKAQSSKAIVLQGDFFETDWRRIISSLPKPILIIGNPPWITNTELGTIASDNLPPKSNFHKLSGLDAKTGKSNFDISEWMLIRLVEAAQEVDSTFAIICKTSVARKILFYAWKNELRLNQAEMVLVDAKKHFNVTVNACVLLCRTGSRTDSMTCIVRRSFGEAPSTMFGYVDGHLVSDIGTYEKWRYLETKKQTGWRSGIKHDCSGVMELTRENGYYRNGLEEVWELEETFLYPMLKSSDIANGDMTNPSRFMLVPQRRIGEDTARIAHNAPKTWEYLNAHHEFLDRRKSSLYRNRPRFSIFGVGEYSFKPWKVAISGLYKKLGFRVIGPYQGRPIVLDDTCYFLPCETEQEANRLAEYLNAEPAQEFFDSLIFWDAKRPITIDILSRLDLEKLEQWFTSNKRPLYVQKPSQPRLFHERK